MSRRIFPFLCLFAAVLGAALARPAEAKPTPTPTATPKRLHFSLPKPSVNPSATPSTSHAGLGRGLRLGADRPSPTPSATSRPIQKSSTPAVHKHATAAPAKSPTATPARSPTPAPATSPKSDRPTTSASPPPEQTSPASSLTPEPSATASVVSDTAPVPAPSASETPPVVRASPKLELTLTKFEPPHGSPGDPDYRTARLSYRFNIPESKRIEFPVITFSVESNSGKLFQRRFELPGSAFVEPGDTTEHTVALDPTPRGDWADAYSKSDQAKFSWSIEGKSNGAAEMPLHKAWP
jgi:hypothetical protein